ncbi:MAG: rRNA methyltransferase [Parachlamydiaceae bacterium]|nr:rRNA methyltransferase [Parachlamydiaceae bacterium]
MSLPENLQEAIAKEAEKFNLGQISLAREELSDRYQKTDRPKGPLILTDAERCAYLVARLPATYAVIRRVLNEIHLSPSETIESLLDLGAGPGSAMWAACECFSSLDQITLVENDASLMTLGKRLALSSDVPAIQSANWLLRGMESLNGVSTHDLVILSYSIGEIPQRAIEPLIEACWNLTKRYLVIIEPGTPVGFERIRAIRRQLITLKGEMIAPCPHANICPMKEGDWCHFSERIERSSLHRKIKNGALGYEDEKYSYVIFSKTSSSLPEARVLRHPQKRSGHVILSLCGKEGLRQQTVSKRTPEDYKAARKLEWSERWNGCEQT